MRWWIYRDGEVSDRPYTKEQLAEMQDFDAETRVCPAGSERWVRAENEAKLKDLFTSSSTGTLKEPEDWGKNPEETKVDDRNEQEERNHDTKNRRDPPDTPKGSWTDSINWTYVGGFLLVILVGSAFAVTMPEDITSETSEGNPAKKARKTPTDETSTAGVDPTTSYEVTPLFDEAYRSRVAELFDRAEDRIFVAMYMIKSNALRAGRSSPHQDDWVLKVLKPLAEARDRDVEVRVMLSEPQPDVDPRRTKANKQAKEWLEENDVTVTYNKSSVELHDKVVLIDNKWVIQGSHNWTPTGIGDNREVSLLMKADEGDTWSWDRYWRNLKEGRTMRR